MSLRTLLRPAAVLGVFVALVGGCTDSMTLPNSPGLQTNLRNTDVVQVDRFGIPAIATVFIPTAQKDAYNVAAPASDRANFRQFVLAGLLAFGTANATAIADALQPDIQPVNLAAFNGFLAGGRKLADDVITAELGIIFGGNAALNDDHVNANDKPFLSTFPYLAGPFVP